MLLCIVHKCQIYHFNDYISIASSVDDNCLIHRSLVCELHGDVRTYTADIAIKSLVS